MNALLFLAFLLIGSIAMIAFVRAIVRADEGYEEQFGFQRGVRPQK